VTRRHLLDGAGTPAVIVIMAIIGSIGRRVASGIRSAGLLVLALLLMLIAIPGADEFIDTLCKSCVRRATEFRQSD
jgi:hypothetical protein